MYVTSFKNVYPTVWPTDTRVYCCSSPTAQLCACFSAILCNQSQHQVKIYGCIFDLGLHFTALRPDIWPHSRCDTICFAADYDILKSPILSSPEIWSEDGGDLERNQIPQGPDQQSGKTNRQTWRANVQSCPLRSPCPDPLQFRTFHWLGVGREQSLPISMTVFGLSPAEQQPLATFQMNFCS